MSLYLIIRVFSGVHEREHLVLKGAKELDNFLNTHGRSHTVYNIPIAIVTVALNILSPILGYLIGGENGLWIGVAISVAIWFFSPFARETIVEKTLTDNNLKASRMKK